MHRLRTLLTALSFALLLAGIGSAVFVFHGYQKGVDAYRHIRNSYTTEVTKENNQKKESEKILTADEKRDKVETFGFSLPPGIAVDFWGLQKKNQDVVAWLYMPGLSLSYPILQGENNDSYLHRGMDGESLFAGSIFLEEKNSPFMVNYNTILYGHNMRDGTMFGRLKEYQKQETYEACPYFWVYLPGQALLYRIFSVQVAKAGADAYLLRFAGLEEYNLWKERMHAASTLATLDLNSEDGKVITLSTCTGDSAYRQIVQGIQVYAQKISCNP